jgi:hypothetical protein
LGAPGRAHKASATISDLRKHVAVEIEYRYVLPLEVAHVGLCRLSLGVVVVVGFVSRWVFGEPLEGFFHGGCLSAEKLFAELAVAVDDDEFDAHGGLAKAAPAAAQRLDRGRIAG